jgi:hypothetical protein
MTKQKPPTQSPESWRDQMEALAATGDRAAQAELAVDNPRGRPARPPEPEPALDRMQQIAARLSDIAAELAKIADELSSTRSASGS